MKVKGSALITMPMFITEKHGEGKLKQWLDALEPDVANTFSGHVLASSWYPLEEYLVKPTHACCKLFYGGSMKGAWDMGKYSAEQALKGIYKLFVKVGSPSFIIKRGSRILPSYYEPSELISEENGEKGSIVTVTKFPDIDEIVEHRICGWMQAALELHGCKNVKIDIVKTMTKGDDVSQFDISWM